MEDEVLKARLTGRASRWVSLLQELGHIDTDQLDRLLVGMADLHGSKQGGRVDLAEARRVAAMVLFSELEVDNRSILNEDWPLLFS